jgi:hypothetical protein
MDDQFLLVYAQASTAPPLRVLRDALVRRGYPASIGVDIAGEATEEQLAATDWETAIVRWSEPELHEVCLIERDIPGKDEEADRAIGHGLRVIEDLPESSGRLIARDHLRHTRVVYSFDVQPPLILDEDHPAWDALDLLLRTLAENTDGVVYGAEDGFYDGDGEILLDLTEED